MFTKLVRRLSGVSRRFVTAATLIAVVVIGGLALLLTRSGSKVGADADLEPRAARIERIEGDVRVTRVDEEDWAEATLNDPVEVGDRIYSRNNAHCSVALTGHNYVRLNPETSLDVLALADQRTQLALRGGSAFFDVGALEPDELYEVATPSGAVDFNEPGLYQIGMEDGNVIVSVLSGLAQVIGEGGSQEINAGEVITLLGSTAAQAISSKLTPTLGGEIVDDYYRYRYPTTYDGRYRDYSSYVSDPFYYDPYRSSQSCRYVPADVPGIYDLDSYGDWTNVSGYGNCWAPRVGAGWAPFREGAWNIDGPWGPTWVSSEPWGWAPYHYGRWTFAEQRWFWVPRDVVRRPAYCAAPVAFIPLTQTAQIAWVPLAPGEPFVQRYYDRSFQPRYLAPNQVIREERLRRHFANFDSPSGLTVVPVQAMGRFVDSRTIAQVDPKEVARNQAVLDPFSIADVRQIALRDRERRRRIKLAPDEQESLNRQVITSTRPVALPARGDLNKAFHIAQLPDGRKKDRMKAGTIGQVVDSRRGDGLPKVVARTDSVGNNANERDQQVTALAERANQGDKSARRELRQLRRETREGGAAQPNQDVQQAQLRQQKQQSRLERQQKAAAAGQQESTRRAQTAQVEAQRQEKQLRRQQETANQQGQPAKKEQRKELKEQSRMQRAQQDAAQQTQRQMRQQQKQQKRQERKPPQASAEPVQRRQELRHETAELQRAQQAQAAAQQRQQLKAQRHQQQRAMNEQQSRSVAMGASEQLPNAQSREQMKAQRRNDRLQSPPPTLPVTQGAPAQSQRKAEKAKRKNDGN
jgi:hypothetical protein